MSTIVLKSCVYVDGDEKLITQKIDNLYYIENVVSYTNEQAFLNNYQQFEIVKFTTTKGNKVVIALSQKQWETRLKPELDKYLSTGSDASCKYVGCEIAQEISDIIQQNPYYISDNKGKILL